MQADLSADPEPHLSAKAGVRISGPVLTSAKTGVRISGPVSHSSAKTGVRISGPVLLSSAKNGRDVSARGAETRWSNKVRALILDLPVQ